MSIHQPHVCPIVRGKTTTNFEFGAKIQVCLMDGFGILFDLSWDAFKEGTRLISSNEIYKARFGYYSHMVAADMIHCNRENKRKLKRLDIEFGAMALGRARAVDEKHIRSGERNQIEDKFGQAKTTNGMYCIRARLQETSESLIAAIIVVFNLVRLAMAIPYALKTRIITFSSKDIRKLYRLLMRFIQTRFDTLNIMKNEMIWLLT